MSFIASPTGRTKRGTRSVQSQAVEDYQLDEPYPGSPPTLSQTRKNYAPRLSYGYSCAAGSDRTLTPDSGNQDTDRIVVVENVFGFQAVHAFAVFDGYGLEGHKIAAFLSSRLKVTLEQAYTHLFKRRQRRVIDDPPFPMCVPKLQVPPLRLAELTVRLLEQQLYDSPIDQSYSGSSLCLTIVDGREVTVANIGCNRLIFGREEKETKEPINEGDFEAFPNFPAIPPVIAAAMKYTGPEEMSAEASEAARIQAEKDAVLDATSKARKGTAPSATKKKRGGFGASAMSMDSLDSTSAIVALRRKRASNADGRPPSRVDAFFSSKYASPASSVLAGAGASALSSPSKSPVRGRPGNLQRPKSSWAPPSSPVLPQRPKSRLSAVQLPGEHLSRSTVLTLPLTVDQTPDRPDEKKRLLGAGGRVAPFDHRKHDIARVFSMNMNGPGAPFSRILGYSSGRVVGIDSSPELASHTVLVTDRFFILATDGVWQVMTSEEAVGVVWSVIEDVLWGGGFSQPSDGSSHKGTEPVFQEATRGGMLDPGSPARPGTMGGYGTRRALERASTKLPSVEVPKEPSTGTRPPAAKPLALMNSESASTTLPRGNSFAEELRSMRMHQPLLSKKPQALGKSVSRIAKEKAQEYLARAKEDQIAQTLTMQGSSVFESPEPSLLVSRGSFMKSKGLQWDASVESPSGTLAAEREHHLVSLPELVTRAMVDPTVLLHQPIRSEPGYLLIPRLDDAGGYRKEMLLQHCPPSNSSASFSLELPPSMVQSSSSVLRRQASRRQFGSDPSWALIVRTSGAGKVNGMGGGAEPARNYLEEFLSRETIVGRAKRRQEIAVVAACRLLEAVRLKWRNRKQDHDDISIVVGVFEEQ